MEKTQKEIIKEICEEFECTQIELAEKVGVSTGTVRQWSSGARTIPNYFYKTIQFIRDVRKLNAELAEKYKNNTQ